MDVVRITETGQIPIPVDILKKLGLKKGDKVMFFEEDDKVIIQNAGKIALDNVRQAFYGEADRLGIHDEQDVAKIVDEIRDEMWKERYANRLYRCEADIS